MHRNGVSVTTLNDMVQLLSHLLWVMGPLLGPLSNVRYVVLYMYALLRVMLESYTSTPDLLECLGLCIHLGVHDHPVANDTCRESLDMTYQCVANEVLKIPTTKIQP